MRTYLPTILTMVIVTNSLAQGPGALREGRQRTGADFRRQRDTLREQVALEPKATTGLIPLTDMRADASYRGEDGGLYGQGRNTPPENLMKLAMAAAVRKATGRYPNLKLIYLSSRTYAGYATRGLNPEPYAYESAYAVRWLIQDRMARSDTNTDPAMKAEQACILLWGPYLWADGEKGRTTDPMVWLRHDYAGDGTHPSSIGNRKVAERMLAFFKTDPTARNWFLSTKP